MQVSPQGTTPEGLAGLTSFGLLKTLEHLALYDAELPCDSLALHLAGATRLSSLQFGLSSISNDFGTLHKLPKLQVGGVCGVVGGGGFLWCLFGAFLGLFGGVCGPYLVL
jgi:hypothetical protein